MPHWFIIQLFFNLAFMLGGYILWSKTRGLQKKNPHISAGLDNLKSQIAILEDLSDRTEAQVQESMSLVDQKVKELQGVIGKSDKWSAYLKNAQSTQSVQNTQGAQSTSPLTSSTYLQEKDFSTSSNLNSKPPSLKMQEKSNLGVAEVFQDQIPHDQIIDRQNKSKYMKAAKMAYQGLPKDKILKEVSLPISEIDFIIRMNRDQPMSTSRYHSPHHHPA